MIAALARSGRIEAGVHRLPLRVYYEDTDAARLVYFANYLKFAERARTEMLRCCGIDQERLRCDTGIVLVVRRCTVDYLGSARLDDDLVVVTRLVKHAGASLEIAQDIERDTCALVRIVSRIACIGAGGRATRLPPPLVAAIVNLSNASTTVTPHAR